MSGDAASTGAGEALEVALSAEFDGEMINVVGSAAAFASGAAALRSWLAITQLPASTALGTGVNALLIAGVKTPAPVEFVLDCGSKAGATGDSRNLAWLADGLESLADCAPRYHVHVEWYPGHAYLSPASVPAVFMVTSPARTS